jgi:hypothetical protein
MPRGVKAKNDLVADTRRLEAPLKADAAAVVAELDEVLAMWESMEGDEAFGTLPEMNELVCVMASAAQRLAPQVPSYREMTQRALQPDRESTKIDLLAGVLRALRSDYSAGRLQTVRELIHGDLFADFLEMAEHLLSEAYKDAAAVIGGSALEAHLQQLAGKHGIPTERDGGKRKKASRLNDELKAVAAYGAADHKSVTAWLDVRNDAAHGEYDEYGAEQVKLLIAGVRDFMVRKPA